MSKNMFHKFAPPEILERSTWWWGIVSKLQQPFPNFRKGSHHIVVAGLICAFAVGIAPTLADNEATDPQETVLSENTEPSASFILTQPKPYTRAQEYIQPGSSMSTLSGNPFTGGGGWGSPYGGGYLGAFGPGYGGYGAPLIGAPIYGGGYFGNNHGGWGSGWGHHGYGGYFGGYPGIGYSGIGVSAFGYGSGAGANPFVGGFNNEYGGFGNGYGSYGGKLPNAWGSGYGGFGAGYGGWGNGYNGYGMGYNGWGAGIPGFGYGGYGGGYGGLGGFGGGTQLGLTMPSHVVQTEPSKASGNYYAPSTVDTTASGSYYAQTDSTAVQMPVKRSTPTSNYWKQDSSSNYWGSGGGSATPFGKDLNSVPWNK